MKLLNNLRSEFKEIAKAENLNLNDFPNPDKFRSLVQKHDISKFPKFKEKWRANFDRVLTVDIPTLMKQLPNFSGTTNDQPGGHKGSTSAANPFAAQQVHTLYRTLDTHDIIFFGLYGAATLSKYTLTVL